MRREPIYGLDIVRFLAAAAVLFYHLGFKAFAIAEHGLHQRLGGPAVLPAWTPVSWWGWIGVQVFFVISGLVIAYSSEGATWSSFARSRIVRLLPTMVISATLIAIVVLAWDHAAPAKVAVLWLKSVTFFPWGPWLSGQFWTLPVEIAFYGIVWLMIVGRQGERLETLAWGLAIISAAYWAVVTTTGLTDTFGRLTQLLMLQHGCYFALGMVLSVIDKRGASPGRLILAALCVVTAWFQVAASAQAEHPGHGLETLHAVPFAIWLGTVGLIAASLYWKAHIATWVGPRGGVLRAMGLATYPLYLIHMHIGGPLLIGAVHAGAPAILAVLLAFAGSVAVALVIALVVEPPLHGRTVKLLRPVLP